MAAISRGDIVLVPFPFTDLSYTKVRPAVVVSADPQKTDMTVAFISSISSETKSPFEVTLRENAPGFKETGLKRSSIFRMSKLVTLERSIIVRRLGKVPSGLQAKLDNSLTMALGLKK